MIYELRQQTRYLYTAAVPYSSHVARLLPVDRKGQVVRRAALSISPAPAERRVFEDHRACAGDFAGYRKALDQPQDHEQDRRQQADLVIGR